MSLSGLCLITFTDLRIQDHFSLSESMNFMNYLVMHSAHHQVEQN